MNEYNLLRPTNNKQQSDGASNFSLNLTEHRAKKSPPEPPGGRCFTNNH